MKTHLPALCNMGDYMLSAADIESVFHPILEDINICRDRNLVVSIPIGLNVREHYW